MRILSTETSQAPVWQALRLAGLAVLVEPEGRPVVFLVPEVDGSGSITWRNGYAPSGTAVEVLEDNHDDSAAVPGLHLVTVAIRSGTHFGLVVEVLRERVCAAEACDEPAMTSRGVVEQDAPAPMLVFDPLALDRLSLNARP